MKIYTGVLRDFIFWRMPLPCMVLHHFEYAVLPYLHTDRQGQALRYSIISMKKKIFILFLFCFIHGKLPLLAQNENYSWMHPEFNYIQFYDKKDIDPLFQAWQNTAKQKLTVLHMGDSHLQSGYYPERLRTELIKIHGDGGQGIMVNYAAVKTYTSCEITTKCTGVWTAARCIVLKPKLPLGVSGMTVHTEEQGACLSFTLNRDMPKNYNTLKLLVKKDTNCYDFQVETNNQKIPVTTCSNPDTPEIVVHIEPGTEKTITIRTVKNKPCQNHFQFYGLILESSENKGILLHNAGVGASRFLSVLLQNLFVKQLPVLSPDVVILDYGTNDYLYKDIIDTALESEIRQIIAQIRSVCPKSVIMLTTTQDMKKKNVSLKSAVKFVELIHKIAKEEHCLVYDWYWISGGYNVSRQWQEAGLMSKDMVHLTKNGYQLKGQYLADAFRNTIRWIQENPQETACILPIDSVKKESMDRIARDTTKPTIQQIIVPDGQKEYIYTIQSGDTLGKIATQFKVSVQELQAWNGLTDTRIYAGKTLKIYFK